MQPEKKYEQWKAITESDFVTLFIKTWFTFIAVLRELNRDVDVFTADGAPRGDKPFLNAYKEGIMPIVQKRIDATILAQELFKMYPISMRKVMDVFPQYFFQTFFQINREFEFSEKTIDKDSDGKLKERYDARIHVVDGNKLRLKLGISGRFRNTVYDETIKRDIDLRPIIQSVVNTHRSKNTYIDELQFLRDFYDAIMNEVSGALRHYIDVRLPPKGYNQTINSKITTACYRLNSSLRLKLEYNYKYPHEAKILGPRNSYAIIYQTPFNGFARVERENVYVSNSEDYALLMATNAVDWFASYVYALRNALFHEIISPLDVEWQTIFKSAYLILKQISDICISCIVQIEDFVKTQENAVYNYVFDHQVDCFGTMADHVEFLDMPKMAVSHCKIDKGNFLISGWFLATLKLQNGDAEAVENGTGSIMEEDKGFDFSVTLDDDFKIVIDKSTQKEMIEISLQNA